uniref:Rho-GAP domain-containing protein n=1 Tax=Astyanax mexicanus TaxID=7994 RepID=A0A8B9RI79_ASTMX
APACFSLLPWIQVHSNRCPDAAHNKAAVQIREDMKKMVQLPILKPWPDSAATTVVRGQRVFGVSLLETRELGLVKDGVPVVVRKMVEYLRQHGLQQEGLFRVSGSVRAVDSLKQKLDSGEDLDLQKDAEVCTVASLLKLYLRELPEGLVHSSIHRSLIQLHNDGFCKDARELLLRLPDIHYSVLRYLCHFLTQVEEHQQHNRMTALNLATVFGPNVFHVSTGFDGIQEQSICNKIMAKLIQNYTSIFEPDSEEVPPMSPAANIIMVKVSADIFNSLLRSRRLGSLLSLSVGMCGCHVSSGYLEKTIRSAVEQHLFDVPMQAGQGSPQDSESAGHSSSPVTTARQRRRQQREQEDNREKCRYWLTTETSLALLLSLSTFLFLHTAQLKESTAPAALYSASAHPSFFFPPHIQTPTMKIQEALSGPDPSDGCEDVPRLDLSTLTEDSNWGEPVPAYSSWQRESMDREEARLSPHAGGRLIQQLLEEDSDPMLSPRFYAYGKSQQYLEDTEVPPSPPNAHSFISRRRSSSLGSCDDDREELTSAQLSKKIHNLKRKIRKYEEKFEDERKYRPSHSDKAANPEVLRWMNELAKLRKDLKEHKLLKSEEDLSPLPRQRSNTLPKSFGSQLEKKAPEAKAPKPPVESTLESVMSKLQEKRSEVGRPEDIKDMTREQIASEKVALQKALLYYESIHGRPVTKTERQIMKPLYDRYRLVKQILCRASTIPVIGSPSSKRRGPQLQPIIEGVPALFFDHNKEEEDGSDEDDNRSQLTERPELSMLGFLDHLDDEVDGFISPVDELSPSKNTNDMRLSNLHAATMQELVEQLQEAREEKKRIRKNLREFEDQFFRQNGRNVQKEDRSPLAVEYNEYKHLKAKLRLLEVLISKRDASKFI